MASQCAKVSDFEPTTIELVGICSWLEFVGGDNDDDDVDRHKPTIEFDGNRDTIKCSNVANKVVCISPIYVSNSSISSMKKQATKMKSKLALIFAWMAVIVGQTNSVECLAIDQNSPAIQNIKPVVEAAGQPATVVIPSQAKSADTEQVRQDYRRPIWALAHMVNSIKELDYRLG